MDSLKIKELAEKYADELIKTMKSRMVHKSDISYIIASAMLEYQTELLKEIK